MATIKISSGHGKYVSGASKYIDEVTEARKVVKSVSIYLKELDQKVYEFHDDTSRNQRDNVNRIVSYHNSKNGDLDVSVHFNAAKVTDSPMGVEVLYLSESGRKVAEKLAPAISKASGLKNRGAKKRTNLGFLNNTKDTAVLIEVCFVDSKADVELYKSKFDAICRAIAETVSGKKLNNVVAAPKTEVKTEVVDKPSTTKKELKDVIEKGDKGYIVGIVQLILKSKNHKLSVDNDFGVITEREVELFQRNKGLTPDGRIGDATWKELTGDVGGVKHYG